MFKSSQRHEGSLADMSKSTLIFHNSDRYQGYVRASHACKLPSPLLGYSLVLLVICREAVSTSPEAHSR